MRRQFSESCWSTQPAVITESVERVTNTSSRTPPQTAAAQGGVCHTRFWRNAESGADVIDRRLANSTDPEGRVLLRQTP